MRLQLQTKIKLLLLLTVIAVWLIPNVAIGATERSYQIPFCEKLQGEDEFVLPDRTRIDCLTQTHAIEVDFARKWAECIGQALHYANQTQKFPGCVLIMRKDTDRKYLLRGMELSKDKCLGIQFWTITDIGSDITNYRITQELDAECTYIDLWSK